MSIQSREELEEALAQAQAALDRYERENEKLESLGIRDDDDEPEWQLVTPGIDDFRKDRQGGIWCAGERIGGPDVIDNRDPLKVDFEKSLQMSQAELQQLGIKRARDEAGRYVADPEPEGPLYSEPCGACGAVANMRSFHPTGVRWDRESGQAYVRHLCKCGEERLTIADEISDEKQKEALFEEEVMAEILYNHMPREPRY